MSDPKLSTDDFDFSLRFHEEENAASVTHFEIADHHRGNGHGSFVIETIKRIALKRDGITELHVSMGGGKAAEDFLKANGFEINQRREYSTAGANALGSDYGVDAIYKKEWVSDDYNR